MVALAFNSSIWGAEAEGLPGVQGLHKFYTSLGYIVRPRVLKQTDLTTWWEVGPVLPVLPYLLITHVLYTFSIAFINVLLKVNLIGNILLTCCYSHSVLI